MYKTPLNQKLPLYSYSLILSGALGNVWDRINYGYVVDFIHFYYKSWSFPAFNIADIAISIGAFLLIVDAFLEHKREKQNQSQES